MKLKKFWLALHISLSFSLFLPVCSSLPFIHPLFLSPHASSSDCGRKGNDLKPIIGFRCTHLFFFCFFPFCDKIILAARYTCFAEMKPWTLALSVFSMQLHTKNSRYEGEREMLTSYNCSQLIALCFKV